VVGQTKTLRDVLCWPVNECGDSATFDDIQPTPVAEKRSPRIADGKANLTWPSKPSLLRLRNRLEMDVSLFAPEAASRKVSSDIPVANRA